MRRRAGRGGLIYLSFATQAIVPPLTSTMKNGSKAAKLWNTG